jgi:hypothetical protein
VNFATWRQINNNEQNILAKFQGKLPPKENLFLNCFWGKKISAPFIGAVCRQQQLFGQVLA